LEHAHGMAVIARQLRDARTEKDHQMGTLLQRVTTQEQAMIKANKY
jgi:hypothetical protein